MTVSSTTSRKTYKGDGATTSFATNPVVFFSTSDLLVYVVTTATGAATLLTLNTHYTVTGGSTTSTPALGTVNLAGGSSPYGAPSASQTLLIVRSVAQTQAVDFVNNQATDAEVAEAALDKLTILCQQLYAKVTRALRLSDSDATGVDLTLPTVGAAADRAGKGIGFDAVGALTTFVLQTGTSLVNLVASTGAALIGFIQSGTGAVATTIQDRDRLRVHVFDFMTATEKAAALANTASVGVRASLQKAIDAVRAAGGGDVEFGPYPYLIDSTPSSDTMNNGLVVPYSADEINGGGTPKRVRLICTPQTRLLAGNDNMIVVRFSDSLGAVLGFPSIEANGHTGVWGMGLVPENMTQTTTCVFQCYNKIEAVTRGTDEGLVLKGGPNVAGRDSGCWYNEIYHFHFSGKRGRWLRPPTNGSSTVTNRNIFRGRVGGGCNVGTFIESGTTNRDYTNYEGVNSGTSPEATPTGVIIRAASDNADNEIYGVFESCTRSIENAANSTKVYCTLLDESKCLFTVRPVVIISRLQGAETQTLVETQNLTIAQNAPATPKANRVYANSIIKAWGNLDGRLATFTVFSAMNCSVVRNALGDYTVTLTTGMLTATAYAISAIATDHYVQIDSANLPTAGSFRLLTKTDAGAAGDPVRLQFMVVGQQS